MVESSISNSQNVGNFKQTCATEDLYDGEEAEGFDNTKGGEWIYPINFPVRRYQKSIVSNALFKNTLVCLPTGLGKTFIAAVVMYNYHRWYPLHKIVFMAHSKPLVAQQVKACSSIVGIPPSVIAELNGNMQHSSRKKQWESKKIFFLTPQVFSNDLARGNVKAESIRCLVIDEAHKALGNQAYCQVIRAIKPFNSKFRVLALSATPGDDMNMVREVIQNLLISHLELRKEDDPDIKPYLHEKKVETVVVKLDQKILDIKEMFFKAVDKYIQPLVKHKLVPQSFSSINAFSLLLKQRQFLQDSNIQPELRGIMLSNFSVAISLFGALEELTIHGMRSFVTKLKNLQTGEGTANKKNHYRITNDNDIKSLIDHVTSILAPDPNISLDGNISITRLFDEIDSIENNSNIVYSHPKFIALENIIKEHFNSHRESTKVIVFCKSRQCTGEICQFLARFKPLVKPMIFIGQSQSSGGIVTKGFNQSVQLTVMKRFRDGVYNTLIATCVAEEGLDIGEVDLIVNFDSGKNSNTQVQRSGRTGRKRDGRVVNLVTEGKEHHNYNISVSKGKRMSKKLVCDSNTLPFYSGNVRLFPKGITPICMEMYFSNTEITQEEPNEKKRKNKAVKKKLQNGEEGQTSKRLKESIVGEEVNSSLWTTITDEKSKCMQTLRVENRERSTIGNEISFSRDKHNIEPLTNHIEITEVEQKSTITLYNDDVDANMDEHWELEDGLQNEDRELVNEFFQKNNKMLKPKNNFRDLIDLKKINKYCKSLMTEDQSLVNKIKVLQNYVLKENDKEFLNKTLNIKTLEAYINKTRRKLLTTEGEIVTSLNKNQKSLKKNVELDIIPDDFFNPLEDFLPEVMTSTPMRSNKESLIPQVKTPPLAESKFQFWDETDFFNLKEDFSPQRDAKASDCGQTSSHKNKDLSLISITQALDFIKNAVSGKGAIQTEEKEKKNEVPLSPSSPILFCSQKPKTRDKYVLNSPILTQGCNGRWSSRKCLTFSHEPIKKPVSKDFPKFNFNDTDNSDLFAETEVALQNHWEEREDNLNNIEKQETVAKKKKESAIQGLSDYKSSDENTEEYDLAQVNLDENSKLAMVLKAGTKSGVATRTLEESTDKRKIIPEKNDSIVNNRREQTNDEISLGRLDFSSFMKNCMTENTKTPFKESTPVRSRPKMAVVRPVGFENTPMSVTPVTRSNENGSDEVLKNEKQPFTCNFSLFGDDDFGDECFDMEQIEKKNENRKDEVENFRKVDIEEDVASNDSDIFVNKDKKTNIMNNPCPNPEDERNGDFAKMLDDCDLSDGAIEAIEAVELYEKNAKVALKDFDSDDSEDYFVPIRRQNKQFGEMNKVSKSKHKENNKKHKMGNPTVSDFVEREADVSCDAKISSDEENTSGLDDYDSSFVDEREMLTQAQDVDMTAKYLQSTKSPRVVRPGAFKMPESKIHQSMNVFSQMGSEGESEYENDSFCVSEEESHMEVNDISELELAEVILQDRKKRKREKDEFVPSVKKKKFKRVMRIESDSDDDVVEIQSEPETKSMREKDKKSPEVQEVFNSSFPTKQLLNSSSSSGIAGNTTRNNSVRNTIFISSRQVGNIPEIATCLRAKWNVNLHVRSTPEADYIVSWRVGINRILLSDFANGSANAKNSMKEMMEKLTMNFQQPVIIVEDDKNKGLPLTTGSRKFMWAKHSMKTLAKVLQNNVKIIFSRNKDDTARIVVNLCKKESSKGYFINFSDDLHPVMEKRMKFYSSLPGVNVANALRIAGEFSSLSSFILRCNSVQNIMRELGIRKDIATSVYQLLYTAPS